MKNKKVIVFDFDGVLFDSIDLMRELTLGNFKNINHEDFINLNKENIHDALKYSSWEKAEETEEEKIKRKETYAMKKAEVPLYDGIKELLLELSGKYILVVNSSAKKDNCTPLLDRENIAHLFSCVATKEMHTSKVEKFHMISEMYHAPLSEMVFITDTVGDIKEAGIVGIPTIAVTWGVHNETHFREDRYPHLVGVVDSVKELRKYLVG